MRIDKLTPEQIARFKEWSEDWIKIGLSTEPANFDKAIEPGMYAFKISREFDPFAEQARRVAD